MSERLLTRQRSILGPLLSPRSRFLQFAVKFEHVRLRLIHAKSHPYAPLENPSKRERTWQDGDESHQNFHTTLELTNVNIGADKYEEKNGCKEQKWLFTTGIHDHIRLFCRLGRLF